MSYHRELEDLTDEELRGELARRLEHRLAGECDYCRRPLGSRPACKYPGRHNRRERAGPHAAAVPEEASP